MNAIGNGLISWENVRDVTCTCTHWSWEASTQTQKISTIRYTQWSLLFCFFNSDHALYIQGHFHVGKCLLDLLVSAIKKVNCLIQFSCDLSCHANQCGYRKIRHDNVHGHDFTTCCEWLAPFMIQMLRMWFLHNFFQRAFQYNIPPDIVGPFLYR